jgi:hypothetical protein
MVPLFTVKDPLGRTVILDQDRWDTHISVEHPELDYMWIAECLESPDFIAVDTVNKQRRVYYKRSFLPRASIRRFYLKTVTELPAMEGNPCRIITAYIASGAKMGEKLEWPSFSG